MNESSDKDHSILKESIRLFILAVTAFYCILPLFINQGLPYAHDIIFHIFQADQFSKSLYEGNFYPRWIPDSNNGYGSPSFIFYSPLSYYLVAGIKLFSPSITTAMISAIWLGFFLSGITMYIATKYLYGGKAGILPAVFYQLLPFHLWDIYIRGAFAEFFAYIWFPLIFLFLHKTSESRSTRAMVGLSISYAGLILTHLVSGFIISLVIGMYLIFDMLKKIKKLLRTIVSLILGFGLSAVFLVPVIFERQFVQIAYIMTCPVGNYKKNFLFTWDKVQTVLRDFYLPVHISVILEILLFILIAILITKNRDRFPLKHQLNFLLFLVGIAFFLTTPLSRPIWDIVPGFPFLQFPWRWISMIEVPLCFLIGAFFSVGSMESLNPGIARRLAVYLLITISFLSLGTIVKSKVIPESSINKFLHPSQINKLMDPPIEYTPLWVKNIKEIMSEKDNNKVLVIEGNALIQVVAWESEKRIINVVASTPSLLKISTFYYPGWTAEIDERKLDIKTEDDSGAMLVELPEGKYILILKFVDTPLRYYAKSISLISLIGIVLVSLYFRKKDNFNEAAADK